MSRWVVGLAKTHQPNVAMKWLQRGKDQVVGDYEQKLEGQRAIVRAMTTQVESLQRQVASLHSLQAENEALKTTVEVSFNQKGRVIYLQGNARTECICEPRDQRIMLTCPLVLRVCCYSAHNHAC